MEFNPIGVIESPFKEKFGSPRQSGLTRDAIGRIVLPYGVEMLEAVEGLDAFSHVWVLGIFHQVLKEGWRPRVRPPRLDGKQTVGVFASRSPHRPNPISLSVFKLLKVTPQKAVGKICIEVSGLDLIDQTPVLDIKPYIAYADALSDTRQGWLPDEWPQLKVVFGADALTQLAALTQWPNLKALIEQSLQEDPRPAHQRHKEDRQYVFRLYDVGVTWCVLNGVCQVREVLHLSS